LIPENNQRTRVLSYPEESCLEQVFRPEYWCTVLVALHSSVRQGEQFGMEWDHVDFEAGTIYFPHTKPHRRKWVYMNDTLRAILLDLHQKRTGPYVFETPTGKKWNIRNFLKRVWEPALKAAGIEDLCWHDLRHTAATRMKAAGVDLYTIKEVLGQTDIRTTQRYAHVENHALRQAMSTLVRPSDAPHSTELVGPVVGVKAAETGKFVPR
jgi:integrase